LVDVYADIVDLYAFQFDVAFNPAVLSAIGLWEGPLLATGGSTFFIPGAIDNTLGTISFTANTLVGATSGSSGSGGLATIYFTALGPGTSPVDLSNIVLLDSGLNDIVASSQNGTVDVLPDAPASVPEPASLLLFGSGLVVILAKARSKRTR